MAGRPLKFATVEELQQKIDAYFAEVEKPKAVDGIVYFDPVTITGLALALDTTRELLCNYEERDQFSDTVKRAKLRCEHYAEKMLYGKSPTGPIFALKNFNWTDKHTSEITNPDGSLTPQAITVKIVTKKD